MVGLNKVILMGNLTRDPELNITPSGVSVTTFSIAVGRRFAKQGDEVTADFFNIEVWRNTADFVFKYFIKGKPIVIIGTLQNRNRVDRNGVKRYGNVIIADEVYFAGDVSAIGAADKDGAAEQNSSSERVVPNFEEISGEDDLPF